VIAMSVARILHVVPHPGGGGETYIRYLRTMGDVEFETLALTGHGRPYETPLGLVRLARAVGGYDLVHIHGDSAALVSLPVIGRRPTVVALNGLHLARRAGGVRGRAARAGLRRAFERSGGVIAVSDAELALCRQIAPGASARMKLVYNGVPERDRPTEEERRATRERLGLRPSDVAVVFAAELTERKQPLQFAAAVEAAREAHPEIVGLVLGEGPLREKLEPMRSEGLRLLGHRGDFLDVVGASDIACLPSLWEGLAYGVLEAMALGRATVVSDGAGNPDAVGDTGLVFPAGDVSAMAAAFSRLADDSALRGSLGEAAVRRARECFSIDGMVRGTAEVYESTLGHRLER
jgi:glycosyltransferase involved in cell wall biosynthesis